MSSDAAVTAPSQLSVAVIKRDVVATFIVFALNGAVLGSWTSRVPAIRDHLHAQFRVLGLVFLCMGLGSLISMPFTGWATRRFSTLQVSRVMSVGACLVLPTLSLIGNTWIFAALFLFAGMFYGAWDVTLNVHGAAVEERYGKPIMPMLHGSWSAGLLAGSGLGAIFAGAHMGLSTHLWITIPVLLIFNLWLTQRWNDLRHIEEAPGDKAPGRILTWPIILMGLMVLFSSIGEGSATDWLALHINDDLGKSQSIAATGYVAYALTLTIGRLIGGKAIERFGRVLAIRFSGVVAAAGIAITILAPGYVAIYAGPVLWGLGLAVVFPATISAAGERGGKRAGDAIAAVSSIGYGAFLVGPPVIGFVAQHFGLEKALWIPAALGVAVTLLAFTAAPPRRAD
ncbi:MAG TPA: MFS transporter [Mycobacteriales bacterium]|jgi:MFS family permease|nr:MFS transporter [Mycobacteriales bacterium]